MSDHLHTLSLIDSHILWLRQTKNLTVGSCMNYKRVLLAYADLINGQRLEDVSPEVVEDFIRRPRSRKAHNNPGAPATVSKDRAILSGFYRWLTDRGMLAANPAALAGKPRVVTRQPKPVPDHIFTKVWQSALPIERVWLGLGGFVGLRRAEIVSVHGDQFLNGTIVSFVRKGGGDDTLNYAEVIEVLHEKMPQILPNPTEFLEPLHNLASRRIGRSLLPWDYRPITPAQAEKHGLPIGSIDPQILGRMLKRTLRKADLPDSTFTPHALRHTAATNLIRAGVPLHIVQSILAHSDISTTLRYVKVSGGALSEWRRSQANGVQA